MEIERLLRVLLAELLPGGIIANIPALAAGYSRTQMRASFFPFGQGIRNCIGEGFAWAESMLLLSAIAARWKLRLADGATVSPVVSSTLVPSELPVIVTRHQERW